MSLWMDKNSRRFTTAVLWFCLFLICISLFLVEEIKIMCCDVMYHDTTYLCDFYQTNRRTMPYVKATSDRLSVSDLVTPPKHWADFVKIRQGWPLLNFISHLKFPVTFPHNKTWFAQGHKLLFPCVRQNSSHKPPMFTNLNFIISIIISKFNKPNKSRWLFCVVCYGWGIHNFQPYFDIHITSAAWK
jgi:hypothetical protein